MLDTAPSRHDTLPAAPGVGFKAQHFDAIMRDAGAVRWVEIHAENYLGDGGRPLAQLRALAARFPVSVHGVGLSIGGEAPPDPDHLARLRRLCDWLEPASFSEHLAWSTHDSAFLNDLLPLPYTDATLTRVADHIDEVQEVLGRRMLLENPSSYLAFAESTWEETEFLAEVVRRTGCGLLLDVNNVFVSATNLATSPQDYIAAFPVEHVGEIHLGGHDEDEDDHGAPLLIDSHGRAVADPVWALLDITLARSGPKPVPGRMGHRCPRLARARRRGRACRRRTCTDHGKGIDMSQAEFTAALLDAAKPAPEGLIGPTGAPAGKRYDVYRNNVAVSLSDALEAAFPAIRKLVGDTFFRAMAGVYLRAHPPTSPLMMHYGQQMPDFLAAFPPVAHLPYLGDVARIELAVRRAYHAADATPVDPAALARCDADTLMGTRLRLAPALRLIRSAHPVATIWLAHRPGGPALPGADAAAEDALIARPGFDPVVTALPPGGGAFVAALMAGDPLGRAADAGEADSPAFALAAALGPLLAGQAIVGLDGSGNPP
jgi:uncharacterized protein (UPF0276 family)